MAEEENKEQENIEENETVEEPETAQEETPEAEEISLEDRLKEAEEKYIRVHADFENIKKRMEREKAMAVGFANESFAKDLLPVIDTLEMALQTEDTEAFDKLKEGVELTKGNLIKALEKHGIKEIGTEEGFDPNIHEAVMQTPSEDHEDGQIVQLLQKGYIYKDRVIRAAMVSICKK